MRRVVVVALRPLAVGGARKGAHGAGVRDLPASRWRFARGALSYTKVRALTRVAAMHDEDSLLRYALDATAPQVEERCRQIRNVQPDSVRDARRAWDARSFRRGATSRAARCACTWSYRRIGELVMKAIERALEKDHVADGVAGDSTVGLPGPTGRRVGPIARTYLDGGATESGSTSVSAADRYQVVVHVDETALHGGVGRADVPLETVKRLRLRSSVVVVTEDERGAPLNVGASSARCRRRSAARFGRAIAAARSRAVTARSSWTRITCSTGSMAARPSVDNLSCCARTITGCCMKAVTGSGATIKATATSLARMVGRSRAAGIAPPTARMTCSKIPPWRAGGARVPSERTPPWRCAKSVAFIACGRRATRFASDYGCACGAAGFDDPANNVRPSSNVTVAMLAVGVSLRACQPSTNSTVPGGRSSRRQPRRISPLAPLISSAQLTTLPSSPVTSR